MNEEEIRKGIEILQDAVKDDRIHRKQFIIGENELIATLNALHRAVDLEKELQQEKETSHHLQNRLDEADAKLIEEKEKNKKLEEVIDLMAEEIWRCNAIDCDFKHFKDNICKDEQDTGNKQICKECIKQYYFKKARKE